MKRTLTDTHLDALTRRDLTIYKLRGQLGLFTCRMRDAAVNMSDAAEAIEGARRILRGEPKPGPTGRRPR